MNRMEENSYTATNIKLPTIHRSARPTYGNDAIGYVQLKRKGKLCTVKSRVTPEHKVKSKPYHCTFICNEQADEIKSIECSDCAASKGGCKHAIALVMWLNRRSAEPSCSSIKCYWAKAKLSKISTTFSTSTALEKIGSLGSLTSCISGSLHSTNSVGCNANDGLIFL